MILRDTETFMILDLTMNGRSDPCMRELSVVLPQSLEVPGPGYKNMIMGVPPGDIPYFEK